MLVKQGEAASVVNVVDLVHADNGDMHVLVNGVVITRISEDGRGNVMIRHSAWSDDMVGARIVALGAGCVSLD